MTDVLPFDNTTVVVAPAVPQNREAEEATIAAVMINPATFHEIRLQLPAGSVEFYIHRHRWIWDVYESLTKDGVPIDFLTVTDALDRGGLLQEIGGPAYLTSLLNQIPTTNNAAAYAGIVHDRYIRRQMIEAANTAAQCAYDTTKTVEEGAAESIRGFTNAIALQGTRNVITLADSLRDVDAMIERNAQSPELPGIPTPWKDYNKLLGGGAQPSDLNLIVGRPGKGKTTALMQIALHAAKYSSELTVHRNRVVIFSLEMPHEQLTLRLIAQMSGIDYQLLRSGRIPEAQYPDYLRAIDELASREIIIDYTPAASPEYIRSRCELWASAGKMDLICVDSLNLMRTAGSFRGREFAMMDECATGLKLVAREFSVPVWAAHQMNRDIEHRGADARPTLADMRDGGEQPADGVMFIHHTYDSAGERVIKSEFVQAKQRNGPTGDVPIVWLPKLTKFVDWTGRQF